MDVMNASRPIVGSANTSSLGNLTSEAIRARAVQFYNSHLPISPNQSNIRKTGSMTHINGCSSGITPANKFGTPDARASYSDRFINRAGLNRQVPPPPYVRSDRPHRTYSERANRNPDQRYGHVIANRHANSSNKLGLYRSNSSLDLEHNDEMIDDRSGVLRRDYGSASSIDVISSNGGEIFAMLREYRNENMDQRSQVPSKLPDYLRGKPDPNPSSQSNSLTNGSETFEDAQSPKLKNKFQKLWEMKDKSKARAKMLGSEPSIFRKLRGSSKCEAVDANSKGSDASLDAESRLEDKLRKKAFAHYDCLSLCADLSYASRLCSLLSKRRNTATGASAASMLSRTPCGSTEDLHPEETDAGDGKENQLVLNCPFFRNELGGEEDRMISLNRMTCKKQKMHGDGVKCPPMLHRPSMACGLSILESANGPRWKQRSCPYQRPSVGVENCDNGAMYYRHFFHTQEHQNWFGIDEALGPVAISVKREKLEDQSSNEGTSGSHSNCNPNSSQLQYQYRLVIRTSELYVLRGAVLEEAIPALSRSSHPRGTHVREVLEFVVPELQLSCLRLGVAGRQTEEQLLKLDEQGLTKTYKVGVMYCKAGQCSEEEMYNNEHSGPAFEEFLELIGQRSRLKGFNKYRAGLDNKTDTTGLYSVHSTYQDCEIMFHVSTLLPYTPNNRQQLLRKRHIGNDIVTIVFQEPDALPFTPKNIRSHFQHVFIVVRAISPCTDHTRYSVAVSRSKEVPVFGPPIPDGGTFPKSKSFVDFLLAKVINAENAAHRSEKFATMAQRTRHEYLKDLATNYVTNATIESGAKFSILSTFGGKKKDRSRPRFIPDSLIHGAISWQVQVDDFGQSTVVNCILGISSDTLVLIEESSREIVFACPCTLILGWSSHTSSMKIFYHQGECLVLRNRDPDIDEIQEIVSRLSCVTPGCETQELILRRNGLGQLGFHVQFDGIVTEVEIYGFAWQAGLRQGSRLVEICKVAIATLNYDQMVDLLKTSMTVTVTVIPPFADGSSRRGCGLQNCSYLSSGVGEYENLATIMKEDSAQKLRSNARQISAGHSQNRLSMRSAKHEGHVVGSRSNALLGHLSVGRAASLNLEKRLGAMLEVPKSVQLSPEQWRKLQGSHLQVSSLSSSTTTCDSSPPPPVPSRLIASASASFPQINLLSRISDKHCETSLASHCSLDHGNNNPHDFRLSSHGGSHVHLLKSFHDHGRTNDGQLTHVSGMVASRSELSLVPVTPNHTRSHSHHLPPAPTTSTSPKSMPDYTFQPPRRNSPKEAKSSAYSPASVHEVSKIVKAAKSSPPLTASSDYQSDSSSDWHQGASSADELSGGSHPSSSPRICGHHNKQEMFSESSYKNRSPRITSRGHSELPQSKLKLRSSTAASGSTRIVKLGNGHSTGASSSSSCSGSSSTLQEDLLKLINPDFLDSDSNSEAPGSSVVESAASDSGSQTQQSTPYSSLERGSSSSIGSKRRDSPPKSRASSDSPMSGGGHPADVIVTMAQPAQVISSEPSSPVEHKMPPEKSCVTDRVHSKAKTLPAPSTTVTQPSLIPLPEGRDIDWTSLVDTATKAIEAVHNPGSKTAWMDEDGDRIRQDKSPVGDSTQHLQELESRVRRLQEDLMKEQHQKATLEDEVRHLREENYRLQEESQSAAAQLQKFTEWVFQNIGPQ